jgi:predicted ATPase
LTGRADQGLRELDIALDEAEKAALRYWVAELLRQKGELLLEVRDGNEARAEACFIESLRIARKQQARSLELRTATSYARLLDRRGEGVAACKLLSPVYHGFTEGIESVDLVTARTQLEMLKSRTGAS